MCRYRLLPFDVEGEGSIQGSIDPDTDKESNAHFTGDEPLLTDGPYSETKELLNGFHILDVPAIQDAVEWVKRAPTAAGNKAEIRRVPSIDEFPEDNEWVQRERAWSEGTGQL